MPFTPASPTPRVKPTRAPRASWGAAQAISLPPLWAIALLAGVCGLGACSTPRADSASTTDSQQESPLAARVTVPPGRGIEAFQIAREALREEGFTLDRVDAPQGVLTTLPRVTEGLGRPWAPPTDSPLQDVVQKQGRTIRVVIRPASAPSQAFNADDTTFNLTNSTDELALQITATVERLTRPTRRLSPDGVRLLSPAVNPVLAQQGIAAGYNVEIRTDPTTQQRLARIIEAALAQQASAK